MPASNPLRPMGPHRSGGGRPAGIVALLAAVATFTSWTSPGCSTTEMLLESDVPLPEGMSTVRSADIRRSGGSVTGGRFLLAGEIDDAGRVLASTIMRFESAGWRLEDARPGLDHATATLEKGTRTARLRLDRRTLDPGMSSGMLEIAVSGDVRPESDAR